MTAAPPAPPQAPGAARARPRRRRRWPWLLLVLALLIGGAVWFVLARRTGSTTAATVQTAVAQPGTVTVSVTGPGTLTASSSTVVTAVNSGTISGLPEVGDTVKQGQLLGTIRNTDYGNAVNDAQLNLERAQAQLAVQRSSQATSQASRSSSVTSARLAVQDAQTSLDSARTTLQGQQQLYAVGAVSQTDLAAAQQAVTAAQNKLTSARASLTAAQQQAQAGTQSDADNLKNQQLAVQQAQETLRQARETAGRQRVTSPLSGVVTAVNVVNGANVSENAELMTVQGTRTMLLPVQVDETEISQVQVGQLARATLDALGGQTVEGRVTKISPTATVSNNISIFTVTVQLPNPDGRLKVGMTAEAEIVIGEQSGMVVPAKAIEAVRTRNYVQVVKVAPDPQASDDAGSGVQSSSATSTVAASRLQGDPERRRVQVGLTDGNSTVVTGGLQPGETVLLPQSTRSTSGSSTSSSGTTGRGSTRGGFQRSPGGFGAPGGFPGGF
ncbi:efflux RND transporter periplasmic adaptor subunit [Deinococcus sonorensis]|uniref:Efflux RND transporter periplasmic adaptor subunit n=2 Tax=Deinococcus sonorensis TaxID=309891 RepID=A0AAU7UEA0_9DEIO